MYYRQIRPKPTMMQSFRNTRSITSFQNNMRNITNIAPSIGKAISIPKSTGLFKSMLGATTGAETSKLGLAGILGGVSKTISTVNQAMPIINQVKPLFGNMKSVVNVIKGFRNKKEPQNNDEISKTINNKIDEENNDKYTKTNKNLQENYQFTPNRPFFTQI